VNSGNLRVVDHRSWRRAATASCVVAIALLLAACGGDERRLTTPTGPTSIANTRVEPPGTDEPVVAAPENVALESLAINPNYLYGGEPATGTVILSSPAPASGTEVALASTSNDARVPATVAVPAGETTATFPVHTGGVSSDGELRITASVGASERWVQMRLLPRTPPPAAPAPSPSPSPYAPGTQTFVYTGASQQLVVPAGVTQIVVDAYGADGGRGSIAAGGLGGRVQATIPVTPGETLTITVGGAGLDRAGVFGQAGGFNGGGATTGDGGSGGGMSDIRRGGAFLLVAGAGGGAGAPGAGGAGGAGGGLTGGNGVASGGGAGLGGSQAAGGNGGAAGGLGSVGTAGASGTGGTGGTRALSQYGGGGGGAGYFGGGGAGGGTVAGGGGGGGSSYTIAGATAVSPTQGVRVGNGEIVITW
jgi:hypothetical protein